VTPDVEIITYALRGPDGTSDRFYRDLAAFTDEVLTQAQARLQEWVVGLQEWVESTGREARRAPSEYVYDCLSLGVLWTVHGARATSLPTAPRAALRAFSRLRRRGGAAETCGDAARSAISGLWISRGHGTADLEPPALPALRLLRDWMHATGNFEDEAPRISLLIDCLADQPAGRAPAMLSSILAFAGWFDGRSLAALGGYTPNVERFLSRAHAGRRWRADYVFTGRTRLEYHLYLVGHELLNRAHRAAFQATRQRLVLAPPCLRARPEAECRAQATPNGAACRGCTPECRIHELTRLGSRHGFSVRIMPDDLRVFDPAGGRAGLAEDLGIVGVSCALTNAPGGLETRALGVAAQGVLLDYCGCRYHWHASGIPTDLNIGRLLQVLGVEEAGSDERDAVRHVPGS